MRNLLITVLVLVAGYQLLTKEQPVRYGQGVLVSEVPRQQNLEGQEPFRHKEFLIKPLAQFQASARVLSKREYSRGLESDLSPLDLALGWGKMSDQVVLDTLDISQSGRWYKWRADQLIIPRREIETHSANMHIVPANKDIEHKLTEVRPGELIALGGYLIQAEQSNGWKWRSSLTRADTGTKACELVWVESLQVLSY
ncbi:MAG: hypothetical protein P8Y12_07930 [Gammaproteobacteria bacterium]